MMIGPPESGKSSLAKAMAAILPPMNLEESLQTSKIYSVAGKGGQIRGLIRKRPFRSPHYSMSAVSLLGGGSDTIIPGEISLAHNGILFIDEFCEAPKRLIEMLRGPMEDGKVTISRLRNKVEYPSDFMLVAATNPCPCGYYGVGDKCTCTPSMRLSYLAKLSGPTMDRIDLQIAMMPLDPKKMTGRNMAEPTETIAARVLKARTVQRMRMKEEGIFCNAGMNSRMLDKYCPLSDECRKLLEKIIEKSDLSARAYHKIIKIARTIADLNEDPEILPEHIAEASGYRILDKQYRTM